MSTADQYLRSHPILLDTPAASCDSSVVVSFEKGLFEQKDEEEPEADISFDV